MNVEKTKAELRKYASKKHAALLQRYFKTGKGEYAEGDVFLGLTVPEVRTVARKYQELETHGIEMLLKSIYHEERMTALLILVDKYKKANDHLKEKIYKFYLQNTKYINNWDLVDLSAPKIVGDWLTSQGSTFKGTTPQATGILKNLAKSENLWERRIAIISTFSFIDKGQCEPTIKIAKMLLSNKHDLIHKAVGWALREVGKKDQKLLEKFLKENYSQIPRTTLRYAIEKFPSDLRLKYLRGNLEKV